MFSYNEMAFFPLETGSVAIIPEQTCQLKDKRKKKVPGRKHNSEVLDQ